MRWPHFIILQLILVVVVCGVFYLHKDKVTIVKTPPASLAQWYKPANKRQVWLHTMFSLRREIQALTFYAERQDQAQLQVWMERLNTHYQKLGEMVPQWQGKLDVKTLAQLQLSTDENRYQDVLSQLDKLNESCDSCHGDYRVVTAITYRAPDFSTIKIDSSKELKPHMLEMGKSINEIKIAVEAGTKDMALSSLSNLTKGMEKLAKTCLDCHKQGTKKYPNDTIKQTVQRLEQSLVGGTYKEQGKELGTLAVQACAHCHGTHRLSYDAKKLLVQPQSWLELLKH